MSAHEPEQLNRGSLMDQLLTGDELALGQILPTDIQPRSEYRRINDERKALRRIAMLAATGAEPAEVFDAVTDEIRRCVPASNAGLWRYETSGEVNDAVRSCRAHMAGELVTRLSSARRQQHPRANGVSLRPARAMRYQRQLQRIGGRTHPGDGRPVGGGSSSHY